MWPHSVSVNKGFPPSLSSSPFQGGFGRIFFRETCFPFAPPFPHTHGFWSALVRVLIWVEILIQGPQFPLLLIPKGSGLYEPWNTPLWKPNKQPVPFAVALHEWQSLMADICTSGWLQTIPKPEVLDRTVLAWRDQVHPRLVGGDWWLQHYSGYWMVLVNASDVPLFNEECKQAGQSLVCCPILGIVQPPRSFPSLWWSQGGPSRCWSSAVPVTHWWWEVLMPEMLGSCYDRIGLYARVLIA